MGLQRTTSMAKGIKAMSPHASSGARDAWDTELPLVLTQPTSHALAPTDADPLDLDLDLGGWSHDGFSGLKMASLPAKSYSYQELLIIALLKLFNASHELLAPEAGVRASSPLQKLFRKICTHPKLGDLPSDSSTLEEMLRKAEAKEPMAAVVDPASEIDEVSQGSERSLLSDDEGEMDLDALDDLDEFYAVSETFGCPSSPSPRRGRRGSDSSVHSSFSAFKLIEDTWAEYDAHFSSSFVKKAGNLARNDACVDLAQLDALVCPA